MTKWIFAMVAVFICGIIFHFCEAFENMDAIVLAGAPLGAIGGTIAMTLEQCKAKFKHIKVLTVIVEPYVYDIDQMTSEEKAILQQAGVDIDLLFNQELDISERICALTSIMDNTEFSEITSLYKGELIKEGEVYRFYVRRPERSHIRMLLPLIEGENIDIDKFSDIAMKNLVVGGDLEALDDGIVYMGVLTQLKGVIKPAVSFLSKA